MILLWGVNVALPFSSGSVRSGGSPADGPSLMPRRNNKLGVKGSRLHSAAHSVMVFEICGFPLHYLFLPCFVLFWVWRLYVGGWVMLDRSLGWHSNNSKRSFCSKGPVQQSRDLGYAAPFGMRLLDDRPMGGEP